MKQSAALLEWLYAYYGPALASLDKRYGLIIVCFPDVHAVELVERQLAREKQESPRWISR